MNKTLQERRDEAYKTWNEADAARDEANRAWYEAVKAYRAILKELEEEELKK